MLLAEAIGGARNIERLAEILVLVFVVVLALLSGCCKLVVSHRSWRHLCARLPSLCDKRIRPPSIPQHGVRTDVN